jgi:hypothetical protein
VGSLWRRLGRRLRQAAPLRSTGTAQPTPTAPRRRQRAGGGTGRPYAGDHVGPLPITYAPSADGQADPGEVVWAWVPFEEGDGRGKDRPVLVVGRAAGLLLALQMTSQDHDRDTGDEARFGRIWMDVGAGAWDVRGRPSEVRLDRVLRLAPDAVRREGARLDRRRFEEVATALRRLHE